MSCVTIIIYRNIYLNISRGVIREQNLQGSLESN